MLRTDLVLKVLCGQDMELCELRSTFGIACRQRLDELLMLDHRLGMTSSDPGTARHRLPQQPHH